MFAGRSVLEVACGTGYWTQFYAPAAERVVAVDAAPETLGIAETRVPAAKVQLVEGDAYRLPSPTVRCNAGFAGFWWSAIGGAFRVLKASELDRHAACIVGS